MLRIRNLILLSLLTVILIIPYYANADRGLSVKPISPSGAEVSGDQWLFVIGIDTYIKWPRLETAVNDAKSIKNVLLSCYHFDKKHLIELYDEQATRKNIIGKLRYLANNIREDDSLFIFYAGHGHLDSITKEGSWIPVESGTKDASAWITNHNIKNYLKIDAIKAKHILLISDSCFAGDFFRGHRGKLPEVTKKVIKKAYQLTSRQAITSGGLEPVSDAGFGKNSVFSHFLVKALKENQKPFLVPSNIFPYIKAGVAENAEQFPQFGSLKGTGGQQGGELVLFLKQKLRLKDLSSATFQKSRKLEHLRQLEAEAKEAKRKEEAEIAKREREVAALDTKIAEMKKRLGTAAADTNNSLDAMLAMVQQKEEQQRHLDELKRKREAEEASRRSEIERLKKERKEKRIAALEADIAKYDKIVSSPFGKDMKASAWKSLLSRYPELRNAPVGDIHTLKLYLNEQYEPAKEKLLVSIQEAINKGCTNNQIFNFLYDKHIKNGSGSMKERVKRFNKKRRELGLKKRRWDPKLITFYIEERCEDNKCKQYLVYKYTDKMKCTVMEIPYDFNFKMVEAAQKKAIRSICEAILRHNKM
jgi:hypothetical protein